MIEQNSSAAPASSDDGSGQSVPKSGVKQSPSSISLTISNGEIRPSTRQHVAQLGRTIAPKPTGSTKFPATTMTIKQTVPTSSTIELSAIKPPVNVKKAITSSGAGVVGPEMTTKILLASQDAGGSGLPPGTIKMALVPVTALKLPKTHVITIPVQRGNASTVSTVTAGGPNSSSKGTRPTTFINSSTAQFRADGMAATGATMPILLSTTKVVNAQATPGSIPATSVVIASSLVSTMTRGAVTVSSALTRTSGGSTLVSLTPIVPASSLAEVKTVIQVNLSEPITLASIQQAPPPPPLLTRATVAPVNTEAVTMSRGGVASSQLPVLTPVVSVATETFDSKTAQPVATFSLSTENGNVTNSTPTSSSASPADSTTASMTAVGTTASMTAVGTTASSCNPDNEAVETELGNKGDTEEVKSVGNLSKEAEEKPRSVGTTCSAIATDLGFEPSSIMEWQDGVGTLPGSNLKFTINEFGSLQMMSTVEGDEGVSNTGPRNLEKPNNASELGKALLIKDEAQEKVSNSVVVKSKSPLQVDVACSDLATCVNCGVKGSRDTFIRQGRFCSQVCSSQQSAHLRIFMKKVPTPGGGTANVQALSSKDLNMNRTRPPPMSLKPVLAQHSSVVACKDSGLLKVKRMAIELDTAANSPSGRDSPDSVVDSDDTVEEIEDLDTDIAGDDNSVFRWRNYLSETESSASLMKCFKESQLYQPAENKFRVGMKLEAVDLQNPTMICVVSVAEVQGFRIRLHFDGYHDRHDFWVNADCPLIFPCTWCDKYGKILHPPKSINRHDFSWATYNSQCKSVGAPKYLFRISLRMSFPPGFKIGMKLEAVDKANSSLVCVASIADIIENWLLVHFDGWDDSYDYWTEITSPHIHPINWCRNKGKPLTPPKDYIKAERFTWEEYLVETKSLPVPPRAFRPRLSNMFRASTKLEVIDKRNPKFCRVATVSHRQSHSIRIHFDGWPEKYDYWIDDDNPDIHHVNWCAKTGHPILPPPVQEVKGEGDAKTDEGKQCPIECCEGFGNAKDRSLQSHASAEECPYSDDNLDNDDPDRLDKDDLAHRVVEANNEQPREDCQNNRNGNYLNGVQDSPASETESNHSRRDRRSLLQDSVKRLKYLKRKASLNSNEQQNGHSREFNSTRSNSPSNFSDSIKISRSSSPCPPVQTPQAVIHQSIFAMKTNQHLMQDMPSNWAENTLPLLKAMKHLVRPQDVLSWCPEQVAQFVKTIPGCEEVHQTFQDELVDGEAFLLLNQLDIVKVLNIKLGPAIKVYNSILLIRDALEDSEQAPLLLQ